MTKTYATRLFVAADLAPAVALVTSVAQSHQLRHVLRLEVGDRVALFNGRDGEYLAAVTGFAKAGAALTALERTRAQTSPVGPRLLVAPVKKDRIDLIVEKATELGVARISPVITRHTAVARVNTERLLARAIEAAEQCGRLTVPIVDEPVALAAALAGWDPAIPLFLCDETGDAEPIAAAADRLASGGPTGHGLLIGPEGGFARAELDDLANLPFVTAVGLGPRILRADTAVVAALAILQTRLGDWSDRDPTASSRLPNG